MDQKNSFDKEKEWLLREKYHGVVNDTYTHDVQRLVDGEPLDYIIGNTHFLGNTIDLAFKPLIPRNETEFWVEKLIAHVQKHRAEESDLSFLDIFSGSGCIGLALLKAFPHARVDFAELEPDLITQIKKNITLNGFENRDHHIYLSDVFTSIPSHTYDYITANPPYLSMSRTTDIQDSVTAHEPHVALFAENDGFALIEQTIRAGLSHLSPSGLMCIEIDPHQAESVEAICVELNMHCTFVEDQFKNVRSVWISRRSVT
jgi:release factor glutamine methyltransferase